MTTGPSAALLPRPRASVVWTTLPDGVVLYASDSELYYSLNHVGAMVWELLAGDCDSPEALCDALVARFPTTDPEDVRGDVQALLDELLRAGLIEAR